MGFSVRFSLGQLLLLLSLLSARKSSVQARRQQWPQKKWILGHRGARAIAPENTLTAFKLAMECGADGVELDVFLSRDGIPVVIHDETLERTTNKKGAVQDLTAAELAQLDASRSMTGFAKEGVPTLSEVLNLLPDGAMVNVELKGAGRFSKHVLVHKVIDILKPHANRLCIIVSSFDGALLKLFRRIDDSFLIALLLSPRDKHWPWSAFHLRAIAPDALHIPPQLAKTFLYNLARRANMRIAIWTVNDIKDAKHWLEADVDGIFTDSVHEIASFLKKSQSS